MLAAGPWRAEAVRARRSAFAGRWRLCSVRARGPRTRLCPTARRRIMLSPPATSARSASITAIAGNHKETCPDVNPRSSPAPDTMRKQRDPRPSIRRASCTRFHNVRQALRAPEEGASRQSEEPDMSGRYGHRGCMYRGDGCVLPPSRTEHHSCGQCSQEPGAEKDSPHALPQKSSTCSRILRPLRTVRTHLREHQVQQGSRVRPGQQLERAGANAAHAT